MTSEEMQRAIEFLLKSQANFEVRLDKTNQQVEQTNRQLEQTNQQLSMFAETQTEFIQTMLRNVEAQSELNTDVRRTMKELAEAQRQTQRDVSELTRIVGGLVKTVYGDGNPTRE